MHTPPNDKVMLYGGKVDISQQTLNIDQGGLTKQQLLENYEEVTPWQPDMDEMLLDELEPDVENQSADEGFTFSQGLSEGDNEEIENDSKNYPLVDGWLVLDTPVGRDHTDAELDIADEKKWLGYVKQVHKIVVDVMVESEHDMLEYTAPHYYSLIAPTILQKLLAWESTKGQPSNRIIEDVKTMQHSFTFGRESNNARSAELFRQLFKGCYREGNIMDLDMEDFTHCQACALPRHLSATYYQWNYDMEQEVGDPLVVGNNCNIRIHAMLEVGQWFQKLCKDNTRKSNISKLVKEWARIAPLVYSHV